MERMSAAERRVARVFQADRAEVLHASAAALAAKAGTSDATVVRATRMLGFSGMKELRLFLAAEMRESPSPAERVAATLQEVGDDAGAALDAAVAIHQDCLERLRREVSGGLFRSAVDLIVSAGRTVIFGIGPSSAMATYFEMQLERFGLDAMSFTRTGLLFADDLHRLRSGDLVVILAYDRLSREASALLGEAERMKLPKILISDTLGEALEGRVDLVLPATRGRAGMFSMHTATLGLIEALLVGIAARRPDETLRSLERLKALRSETAGEGGMRTPSAPRG
ncbi:MAG: RpiR family transcriptional regulator [Rhizobiales bacterium 63-22]|nr:MAG: RpiR family transcriptional regulator [Rhizobiales bacterium 63-22]